MRLVQPTTVARLCALLAACVGCSVLFGWGSGTPWLTSVIPGYIAMNPITAICFLLAGASLNLSVGPSNAARHYIKQFAATTITAVGVLRLVADALSLGFPIDRYLFAGAIGENRMAPNTALCFVLLGISLLTIDVVTRRRAWPAQACALVVATVSLITLVGYAYGAVSLYRIAFIPMALNTAAAFQILSIGVLLSRPQRGVLTVLLHPGPGGVMMRRLLPAVLVMPCLLGWIHLKCEHDGLYSAEFGSAILVVTMIMVFSIAMFAIAAALNRADHERRSAEQATRQLNEDLEDRVQTRTNELEQRDRQLRQAQKMEAVGTLAGGVAHEFNNLLQAIQGFTRYAMEDMDPASHQHGDLAQVLEASDRAVVLTRQLLGFSRQEILQMTDVEPNQLVRSLAKMLQPLIGEHIKIELFLDENVGKVHADVAHLQQMLMNLCVNARDAMPNGGQLSIKTEHLDLSTEYCDLHQDIDPGRYIMFVVADTGTGMSAEVRDHIFDPFFTTKDVGKGTGLGLAMVYGMVRQHGGAIRVYSEIGVGTTFRVYLPTTDHAIPAPAAAPLREIRGGHETILIAEDDPLVRKLAVLVLQRAGYHTIVAVDGEEAVQLFQEHAEVISLALLDVVMPRMGGREAFQRIKDVDPAMKVVFCSGYDPSMAQVGFVLEDDARLVQKPFVPETLLATLREVLDEAPCPLPA